MAGRRLNARSDIELLARKLVAIVDELEPPQPLRGIVLAVVLNASKLPAQFKDDEQMAKDLREALEICEGLDLDEHTLPLMFNYVIEQVSAREHIVQVPGREQMTIPRERRH